MDYKSNITGCLKYNDFSGAENWFIRAHDELGDAKFAEIVLDLFSSLLSNQEFDLADRLYKKVSHTLNDFSYSELKDGFLKEKERTEKEERDRILKAKEEAARFKKEREELKKKRAELADNRKSEEIIAKRKQAELQAKEQKEKEKREKELAEIHLKEEEELRTAAIEAERKAKEKAKLVDRLDDAFDRDYMGALQYYKEHLADLLTPEEYGEAKTAFIHNWITDNSKSSGARTKDLEQAAAIGSVDFHTLVAARAGSGKTATLINRALFLHKQCGVGANEILMLAFNADAAQEMRKRLEETLGQSFPHVMTFHALAYALVHPEKSILMDEPEGAQSKSIVLQRIIDDFIQSPERLPLVRKIMLAHFRQDWEKIIYGGYDRSPNEMLVHRRSLPKVGLDGRNYKSHGEKCIANFLLEHDIKFHYERNFWWNGINYRPDFTIFTGEEKGIIIEYFGMSGDPDYDEMTEEKIEYWRTRKNWKLIQLYPPDFSQRDDVQSQDILRNLMEENEIPFIRLSEEEIWKRIKDRAIDRLTRIIGNFVQRCRKYSLSPTQLDKRISEHDTVSESEDFFLQLVRQIYKSYLHRVKDTGEDDFDGLLQKAAEIVGEGKATFERKSGNGDFSKFRFIMIDEFQDFTELFYKLTTSIKRHAPSAKFFCVGDDWQAINGFAGSDLKYYSGFENYHHPSRKLEVTTNYRSMKSIVEVGNTLMRGLGTPARANTEHVGIVKLVDLSTFQPSPREQSSFSGDALTPVILRLVKKRLSKGQNVVLLSRKNSLPWYVTAGGNDLEKFLAHIRSHLHESDRRRVTISTAHSYKGLQMPSVIVLDAVERCYPLIHPNIIFSRIFGDSPEKVVEEERRLFYVALTRAANALYVISDNSSKSPFLVEIEIHLKELNWIDYPPPSSAEDVNRLFVLIGNSPRKGTEPTHSIREILKAADYRWYTSDWPCWHRSYSSPNFTPKEFVDDAPWVKQADGVEIRFQNSADTLIARCHISQGHAVWDDDN